MRTTPLLDHVSIAVGDLSSARPFYDAIMAVLGARKVYDHEAAIGYGERCSGESSGGSYVTVRRSSGVAPVDGLHWCFKAVNRQQVRAAFAAGIAAGGRDDGGPGLRAEYHPTYYAAFMKDPHGNRIEIVCHQSE